MTNYQNFHLARISFWDKVWSKYGNGLRFGSYYHKRILEIYKNVVPPESSVLEIGCGNGKLIGELVNRNKTGIDFSKEAIRLASKNYPEVNFVEANLLDFHVDKKFDYIILSDLIDDLWDVQMAFEKIFELCHERSRIVINFYSKLWEGPLTLLSKIQLKRPTLNQNWLTRGDVRSLFYLSDLEEIKSWQEILFPLGIPLLGSFLNKFLVKIFFFKHFALTNFMVARLQSQAQNGTEKKVSVIVAARNEAGHIREIIRKVPQIGLGTELIFVEGNSSDNTYEVIEEEIKSFPDKDIRLFKQKGKGKGDAVRKGFDEAKGDIFMILDADLTVPPEKLPLFYRAMISRKGEFINGVRLVYPMEKEAMRFFNLIGNKFFSLVFKYLLGQSIRDTLCGTKCVWREDYIAIARNRSYFGNFDPFGDFDLIFGAAKLNLKIQDLPIRYRERVYGTTNISRWKHGWILLKMIFFAARKIKFI